MDEKEIKEARELIERAKELSISSNHFTTSMSQLQVIYEYKRLLPELTLKFSQMLNILEGWEKR